MTPFNDQFSIILGNPGNIVKTAPESDTVLIDSYREGHEVTNINYFLRSTKVLITSNKIAEGLTTNRLTPQFEVTNLGQEENVRDYSSFEDKTERLTAAVVLAEGLIQDDNDPFFGFYAQDGKIKVFSDSGKNSLEQRPAKFNAKGVHAKYLTITNQIGYSNNAISNNIFHDAADVFLTIVVPGYTGEEKLIDPFVETTPTNKLGIKIEYESIGADIKTAGMGFTYYNSIYGTDSIAFGGRLR